MLRCCGQGGLTDISYVAEYICGIVYLPWRLALKLNL